MSEGLLMRALKAKGKRKVQLDEAHSGATKAGRASGSRDTGGRTTAKSPKGVDRTGTKAQQAKKKAEAIRKRNARLKKAKDLNKKKKSGKRKVTVLKKG